MRPEPRFDAVLVVKVLARKLMDFIFVNEILEADLAVFDIHQIWATDDSEALEELGCGGCTVVGCAGVHELVDWLLDDLIQLLIGEVVDQADTVAATCGTSLDIDIASSAKAVDKVSNDAVKPIRIIWIA